jgi:hypothetical protein
MIFPGSQLKTTSQAPLAPLRVSFSQQLMDVHQFRTEVRGLSLEIGMVYDTAI